MFDKTTASSLCSFIDSTSNDNCSPVSANKQSNVNNDWSTSFISYPGDKCIHTLFEEQAQRTPKNIAVVSEFETLTYQQLDERANQLACYLIKSGVKNEQLIPVCFDRSASSMIAILGIIKAGAAYVPIDPAFPSDRIQFILNDTKATIVICDTPNEKNFLSYDKLQVISLSANNGLMKQLPVSSITANVHSHNLVYVIYTSGSTGNPKGVMIEHRSLVDHCYGVIHHAALSSCNSCALFSPLIFDAGQSMIYAALLQGATLHILSKQLIVDGEMLSDYFTKHEIDCLKIVPSLWLSYAHMNQIITAKKVMIFGGESFQTSIISTLRNLSYSGKVFNHYGPTEVTVGKCIFEVDLQKSYTAVPIGKPFSNTQLYIVDENMQPVPIGVTGEICIGGDGVARGYLNLPDATNSKFVSNRFANGNGRLYKTGDVGKWLSDGNIEYAGRTDDQLKINGYRIEPGEITSAVAATGLARQCYVFATDTQDGSKKLIGFVVPGKNYSKVQLLACLHQQLPSYMVPAVWIQIDKIPLTISGKVDRKQLEHLASKASNFVAPDGDLQQVLSSIICKVLSLPAVSTSDNIFELGTTSIQAVQITSLIRKRLHLKIAIGDLFSAPSIQQLSQYLANLKKDSWSYVVPIKPTGNKSPIFCIHAAGGTVQVYKDLATAIDENQPLLGIQAQGLDGRRLPHKSIEAMASDYIAEMEIYNPSDEYKLVGYCFGGIVAFEIARQLINKGKKVAWIATVNSKAPHFKYVFHKSRSTQQKITIKFFKKYLKNAGENFIYLLGVRLRKLVYALFLTMNKPLPAIIGRFYLLDTDHDYITRYKPAKIRIKMLVFKSALLVKQADLGWSAWSDDVEVVEVQGKHKERRTIMQPPFVKRIASKLSEC